MTLQALKRMEVTIPIPHYVLQVGVVLEIGEVGLGA